MDLYALKVTLASELFVHMFYFFFLHTLIQRNAQSCTLSTFCECMHVLVCVYMHLAFYAGFVDTQHAVCGAERSKVHKTDHCITAYFLVHYRQQGLTGAYNEGPCLGLVMGEHCTNSTHPSSSSICPSFPPLTSPSCSPEVCDPLCPPIPP